MWFRFKLNYFHVAAPGLSPCIAHDSYEGVVQNDLMLVINYFVTKKVFTFDSLNIKLQLVRFHNEAKYEKVPTLKKGDKLSGSATENLRLLQIFPFAVYDIINTANFVWKMLLIIRNISNLVMCLKISIGQVGYCLNTLTYEWHYFQIINWDQNTIICFIILIYFLNLDHYHRSERFALKVSTGILKI